MCLIRWLRSRPAAGIALLLIMLTSIGLATVRDYGAPYDEYVEIMILKSNIEDYAIRLNLPSDSLYRNLGVSRITNNKEQDHGISAYYPLVLFLRSLTADARKFSYWWSVLTWLWFMLGCASLYGFLRALGLSRPIAAVGMLLLYLSPRFFAEGHYNNKDVVLLCFVLLTLWQGARLIRKPGIGRGFLFSLAGAVATNTKIAGALPWCLVGLTLIVLITIDHRWDLRLAMSALTTVATFGLIYLLLTPASWDNPAAFFRYLLVNASAFSRFDGTVIFRGAKFWDVKGETPLPWYYIPYYVLVTVPVYTLILALVGQLATIKRWLTRFSASLRDECACLLLIATLSWVVPMGIAILMRPLVYNGWRHFYFMYAGIVILAGYGLDVLWKAAQTRRTRRRVFVVAVAGCIGLSTIGLVQNRMFQYAYFNCLQPRDAQYTMDLDYWNVSDSGAFIRLYELKKNQPGILKVGCYFNDITIGAIKLPDKMYNKLEITVNTDEQYLYYNSTYASVYDVVEPPPGYHILFENKSYGNTIGVMYEKDTE